MKQSAEMTAIGKARQNPFTRTSLLVLIVLKQVTQQKLGLRYLLRDILILLKLVGHDNEVRAALLALCNEHAGLDAKLARLIVGRGDLAGPLSAVGVADCKGLALEGGVCQACHRCKEAIHVQVDDGPLCGVPT